ncbi:hypothetical protein GH733_003453 [Mirounga leonina]|nr:hypothetical protein GH733_003453 [Mirounga leonina]
MLLLTRAKRGPCSPPRRQWPSRRLPLPAQRLQARTRRCRTVYIAAMATGRFRRSRKYRGSGGNEVRGLGRETIKARAESGRREMGPVNLERLRQLHARKHGRDGEGTKAKLATGNGAAGLPAQSSLRLRQPRRPVCFQPRAPGGGPRGPSPRPV